MYAPINQIRSANDEDEDQTEESFIRYYNIKNFGQAQDLACLNGSPSNNPSKIRQIQEGFDLASPDMKAKKRKAEAAVDVGGRVIRAAGRKDKHSKVCTNRGPRDRRVRLSPRTAIQFYDVQDRLGYDRPSKAIDWLINEAKTAIDALDERQSISFADPNAAEIHGFSLSKHGMREKHEKFDDESLVSGFGCFLDEAAPPSAAASEVGFDQDSIFMRNKSEICPNLEMFAWNNYGNEIRGGGGGAQYFSGNSPPLLAAAQPLSSYVSLFSQREPLQSSFINYSPINNDFNFSNELSKIAASATAKQDQNSKKMSFSMPSATTRYQD